jgi:hypothetical protein
MMRWLFLFPILIACPVLSLPALGQPEIVSFDGDLQLCMQHEGCATFEWVTRGADHVRFESGAIDDSGVFQPGGWYAEMKAAPSGSAGFRIKIGNYAARLCIDRLFAEPVCAVCNPLGPEPCS